MRPRGCLKYAFGVPFRPGFDAVSAAVHLSSLLPDRAATLDGSRGHDGSQERGKFSMFALRTCANIVSFLLVTKSEIGAERRDIWEASGKCSALAGSVPTARRGGSRGRRTVCRRRGEILYARAASYSQTCANIASFYRDEVGDCRVRWDA